MTRVLEDLAIYETSLKGDPSNFIGQIMFVTLEESKDSFLEDMFVIQIRQGISDDKMVPVLCHELEHYDVAQALLNLNLFSKQDLLLPKVERVEANGVHVLTTIFKEWLHSNPSYEPKKNHGNFHKIQN